MSQQMEQEQRLGNEEPLLDTPVTFMARIILR